jgi:hypothetical protein
VQSYIVLAVGASADFYSLLWMALQIVLLFVGVNAEFYSFLWMTPLNSIQCCEC